MKNHFEKNRVFSRRTLLVSAFQATAFGILWGRMAQLQIFNGEDYALQAEDNRIKVELIPAARGKILDREGRVLACNIQNYELLIDRAIRNADEWANLVKRLGICLEFDAQQIEAMIASHDPKQVGVVYSGLTWGQVAKFSVHESDLYPFKIQMGRQRSYPYAESMAHIVGYVGIPSPDESKQDRIYKIPGMKIGKFGLEQNLNQTLLGRAGFREIEMNAKGKEIRELRKNTGTSGGDQALSLNAELQAKIFDLLKDRVGACVVMDIHNGQIYASVSFPSFDPNRLTGKIKTQDWQQWANDESAPLKNRAIGGLYSPGSTFKMLVALAGLVNNITRPHEIVFCPGHYEVGSRLFHCWKHGGHGNVDMNQAIAESCDVYFYDLALRLGVDRIADMAKTFGLGQLSGLGLLGEKEGLVPTQDWKKKQFRQAWYKGETAVTGIGQGYLLATPLQMALMTAYLVNGGVKIRPTLYLGGDGNVSGMALGFHPQYLAVIKNAMANVVCHEHGTAYASKLLGDWQFGGKTGTVQVKEITKSERLTGTHKNRIEKYRDHAMFVGFAPLHQPKFAVSLVVEHGGSAGAVAAPLASKIFEYIRDLEIQ